jgi:hypothetical protein
MVAIAHLILMFLLLGLITFLFVELIRLSKKTNDLRYYMQKPSIPFQEKQDFPYLVNSPSKDLL